MKTGFAVTYRRGGLRYIAGGCNQYSVRKSHEDATKHMNDMLNNNSPETLQSVFGHPCSLRVLKIDVTDGGDPSKQVYGLESDEV